jgi:regulatory protein
VKRPPPSLRARALGWLAQREHSRSELRRKLLRHAEADEADADPAGQVDQLLDALQAKGLLSEERFVESRVRQRAAGMGTRRIQLELAQHGLELPAPALQQLRRSELQRAAELYRRRFRGPATDARERARRMRFLAGRGFSGEVARQVLAGRCETDDEEPPAD